MRQREVVTSWSALQDGDQFVRYTQEGVMRMLVVLRTSEDLPTERGTIGHGTVEFRGLTETNVLLVRRYESSSENEGYPWVAPLLSGTPGHILRDSHIVDFKEALLLSNITPDDLRAAIRSAVDLTGTESMGSMVGAIEQQVWHLLTSA